MKNRRFLFTTVVYVSEAPTEQRVVQRGGGGGHVRGAEGGAARAAMAAMAAGQKLAHAAPEGVPAPPGRVHVAQVGHHGHVPHLRRIIQKS
eukprot:7456900-Pyramimonas_sp.AAC.1